MSAVSFPKKSIFVCDGSKCGKHKEIKKYFKDAIKEAGLKDQVEVIKMECTDRCKHAPIVCLQPHNEWFAELTIWKARQVFEEQILAKKGV
ncbi:MAG: (2Fe-2S) ferredoxin domain-containing protein [Runella slithyformis]|jgi:(2Fe-2S) ferredoxin|nr:MAG: (2Fe-2S) ferredoxin domain-containing protein [Runella slithyformis]TAF29189.1 MAG: (2Fe-2S) ferredoxin domain-containing protein [Runella slithyformis]TAF48085.1 MAG: (2Fe-2S) ferredoxin domain-containing protein [Runella slithyformis]TAF82876.1 MAG: (2Fe-2S) ferredoxin domain-containing protein [Runella slithyformis]